MLVERPIWPFCKLFQLCSRCGIGRLTANVLGSHGGFKQSYLDGALWSEYGCARTSPGRHCHSKLLLIVIDCHALRIYTVILLSFSAKMTVLARTVALARSRVCSLAMRLAIARPFISPARGRSSRSHTAPYMPLVILHVKNTGRRESGVHAHG